MIKNISFADFRAELGLTLEQCAIQLELAPSSRGWLSEIENGVKDASLRLALRIERWSGGRVTAASVNREIREAGEAEVGVRRLEKAVSGSVDLSGHCNSTPTATDNADTVPVGADHGAEKSLAVFSPTEDAA